MRATYRIQLQGSFGFDDAASIADYLSELGISHLYCSPYLRATAGSTHGYDVVDHSELNPELGGGAAHDRMCAALARESLGHIVDIVPNHMAVQDPGNRWWWDVLKNGRASRYAAYFDVDWDPPETALRRKIFVPILGDHYGRVLEAGELGIDEAGDESVVRYHDHVFPLASGSLDDRAAGDVNRDTELLHQVLERQHYRLAYWRAGDQDLNYRRFFDIKSLAALRIEERQVFEDVHRLVFELLEAGKLDGLRVDHIDGLRDPTGYLRQVRARARDAYLVVEKILEPGEKLRADWPIDGTTGYEFLNLVGALYVDPSAEKTLTETYQTFTGEVVALEDVVRTRKLFITTDVLASDVERLTGLLVDVCERHIRYRDFTRRELRDVLRETMASFPVYRTYVDVKTRQVTPVDERYIRGALQDASENRSDLDRELFLFLEQLLLLQLPGDLEDEVVLRFQQMTGPVMAKGVEDTVFYNYNRLVSLNEVGGDPRSFGTTIEHFHRAGIEAASAWPRSLLATSTHDTKRSEDVRVRIGLLSEIPDLWTSAVERWKSMNERFRSGRFPDRNAEYLLYQTLVGAWPLTMERAFAYMDKATKEAKTHTSWTDPSEEYGAALRRFVDGISSSAEFVGELELFVAPLLEPGYRTSLAQTLIKMTWPGVPDLYQGCELWDWSLVDPDNRRPVDYGHRREILQLVRSRDPGAAWAARAEGTPKMLVVRDALALRAERPASFGSGASYEPLHARGAKADHVVAFVRGGDVAVVTPRLLIGLGETWAGTSLELPRGRWVNRFGTTAFEGTVLVADMLADFPVALLTRA